MKKRIKISINRLIALAAVMMIGLSCVGCGAVADDVQKDTGNEVVTESIEVDEQTTDVADNLEVAQAAPYDEDIEAEADGEEEGAEEVEPEEEEEAEDFLPGYKTEQEFWERHTGSASLISEPTILISIFVDEEEDVWTPEEKLVTLETARIAYGYLEDTIESEYGKEVNLIYDWEEYPDLCYTTRIYESISPYVETSEERHIDELELGWALEVPYRDLMIKYETTSVGFLYFIPHEGCSYSSMHFVEDGTDLWNEGCLIYLQDMYSPTYEYETPTVYAHELLHLFGAEDYYSSADVFSKETYSMLKKNCSKDLMLSTFDTIGGVYTTYPDSVPREITPVTAYLLGIEDEKAVEDIPELIREEAGCFPGSTYDRPF